MLFYLIYQCDATLPKAYGLLKVHKNNIPFRLIVSSVNTALYSLASFLQYILTHSLENTNSYTIKMNSFDLYNSLSDKQVRNSDVLISLDAISLLLMYLLIWQLTALAKDGHIANITQKFRKTSIYQP